MGLFYTLIGLGMMCFAAGYITPELVKRIKCAYKKRSKTPGEGPYRSALLVEYRSPKDALDQGTMLVDHEIPRDKIIKVGYQKFLHTKLITKVWDLHGGVLYEKKYMVRTKLGNYCELRMDGGDWSGGTFSMQEAAAELMVKGYDLPDDLMEAAKENFV